MDPPNDGHFDVFSSIAIKRILPNNAVVFTLGSVIDKPRFNSAWNDYNRNFRISSKCSIAERGKVLISWPAIRA